MAKKRYLTFKLEELIPLVEASRNATLHQATFEQLYDKKLHIGGVIKYDAHGFPMPDSLDYSKVPPALWLVKDQGVYLMGSQRLERELAPGESVPVAYALECDPTTLSFDIWWNAANETCGGDDFCEALPLNWFELAIQSGGPFVKLQMLASQIRMVLH